MNNKLCTHPDGCQNEEPRHCLNDGCNETPDEIKTVVCEEIFSKVSGYFPGITIEQKQLIFAAMKKYAERQVGKEDELLKAAITLLQKAYQKVNASHRADRGQIQTEIGQWLIKNVTVREAGKNE